MERIICFDIETTGFDYARGDRVIEIGAIELIDGKKTNNNFHTYINPDGKTIPPDSYMVHKLSNEFLMDKPKFGNVAQKFLDFIGTSRIIAHNGFDFDFPFINYELATLRLPQIPRTQQMDSIVIARNKLFGPKQYSLDALAKWFGISLSARADSHGALIDAEILAQLYLELENTESAVSVADVISAQNLACKNHPKIGENFPRRRFVINDDEKLRFDEFMKNISV